MVFPAGYESTVFPPPSRLEPLSEPCRQFVRCLKLQQGFRQRFQFRNSCTHQSPRPLQRKPSGGLPGVGQHGDNNATDWSSTWQPTSTVNSINPFYAVIGIAVWLPLDIRPAGCRSAPQVRALYRPQCGQSPDSHPPDISRTRLTGSLSLPDAAEPP
jgi:hypothetical protein